MSNQQNYWNQRIEEWTRASYEKKPNKISFIERTASFFRGGIRDRLKITLRKVGPLTEGKIVVDMGCGLGNFCFEVLNYRPQKVIGIDISEVAIKKAKQIAQKKKLIGKVEFIKGNLVTMDQWPEFDIAVGLGFIDYFNKEELKTFFNRFENQFFFFSFFEKKFSLLNIIHPIYVKIQQCPGAYKYTRKEIKKIIPPQIAFKFFEKDGLLFITNLLLKN